jgi:RHS repeat-associated protein
VVTTTDAKGYISEKQYDGFYRLITEKSYRPDTATRDATYTGSGKVLMGTTAYAYDSAYLGNLLTETVYGDASGASYERTSYSYDSLGRRTGVSRGNGTTMTPVATYSYDDTDNIVTEKDYQSPSAYSRTDTKRDWLGRVTGTTAWGGVNGTGTVYTTTQAYNYGGQVTSKTLPNGESYGYTYTRSGLLEGISYPNNRGTEIRSYDGNGRLLTRTDVGSNVTSYAYDGADQETSRTSTAPGKAPITVTTSYSQWGPGTIIQTKNLEQELSIEYGYASRGQVASETRTVGSGSGQKSGTVTHAWDAAGNLSGLTVNGFDGTYAKSLSYSLPGFGGAMSGNGSARSVSVGVAGGDTIGRVSTLYSGVLDEVDYCGSAGTYTQYTNYDSMLRPQTINHPGTDFDQSYGYDYKGNVTGWNGKSYTYDGLDRLSNGGAYTYDAISNMSSGPNATYSYLTNANVNTMRLSAATLGGTTTGYSDDGNLGDLVSATGKYSSLTYDARNELVSLTDTGRSAGKSLTDSYAYGPDGLRYAKTESNADGTSTLTYYWYEGNSILYEEDWQGGTSVRNRLNVYAGGLNIGAYEKAAGVESLRYYYNDHLGSRRAVTDSTGAVLAKIDYSTWGLPTVTSSNGYDGTKDISYTGKEEDATGLYYFNARYYDPSIGRFITEDPIRSGLNWYAYCGNNPLSFTDPSGLRDTEDAFDPNKYSSSDNFKAAIKNDHAGDSLKESADKDHEHIHDLVAGAEAQGNNFMNSQFQSGYLQGLRLYYLVSGITALAWLCPALLPELIKSGAEAASSEAAELSASQLKSIQSYENLIAEHEQKLAQYIKDPYAFDNKGFLKNAPTPEIAQKIIDARIRGLQQEIQTFQDNILKILGGQL